MRFLTLAGVMFSAAASTSASAGVFTDDLSRCVIQKTTDSDKTQLVRWMFGAMTRNPDLASLANISQAQRDKINKGMADIYNRLILVDCRSEAIAAIKNEGIHSLFDSGQALGGAAANKMMSGPGNEAELGKWTDYMDKSGWTALAKEAGVDVKEK